MTPADKPATDKHADPADAPATPYGPHPHGVDEAAGGADSSPYENEPTDNTKEVADENARAGRKPRPGGDVDPGS